jgi:eukaryotic-like serine/threonine-protein kinase
MISPLSLLSSSQKREIALFLEKHATRWWNQRQLNRRQGLRHLQARNWPEAERHFLLALGERRHSTERTLELTLGLAQAQRNLGRLSEAEASVRAVLDLARNSGKRSLQAQSLDALAEVQLDLGRYADALQTAEENARLEAAQSTPDGKRLALCSRRIGAALLQCGRLPDAAVALQHAVGYAEKAVGPEHPETAGMNCELGVLYRRLGNHAEAQRVLRKALQVHRTVAGVNSHEATQDLRHLAVSLEESGDFTGAASEYERFLAMRQRQVGADPEETAEAEVRLAAIYARAGRTGPAQELLTHAISVLERNQGPRFALALNTLGDLEEELGRDDNAKRSRDRASRVAVSAPPPPSA